jgi:malonate-semialdehyde dehydrogenase (acetylating) / methylmalonate-semialdehyde dehydrogenase
MLSERSFTVNVVPHLPLVTREHRDRVMGYIDVGEQAGAKVLVDGRDEIKRDGFFLGCSLLDHVTPAMTVWTDEIFGPVLSVVRVGTLDLGCPRNR